MGRNGTSCATLTMTFRCKARESTKRGGNKRAGLRAQTCSCITPKLRNCLLTDTPPAFKMIKHSASPTTMHNHPPLQMARVSPTPPSRPLNSHSASPLSNMATITTGAESASTSSRQTHHLHSSYTDRHAAPALRRQGDRTVSSASAARHGARESVSAAQISGACGGRAVRDRAQRRLCVEWVPVGCLRCRTLPRRMKLSGDATRLAGSESGYECYPSGQNYMVEEGSNHTDENAMVSGDYGDCSTPSTYVSADDGDSPPKHMRRTGAQYELGDGGIPTPRRPRRPRALPAYETGIFSAIESIPRTRHVVDDQPPATQTLSNTDMLTRPHEATPQEELRVRCGQRRRLTKSHLDPRVVQYRERNKVEMYAVWSGEGAYVGQRPVSRSRWSTKKLGARRWVVDLGWRNRRTAAGELASVRR